MVIHVFLLVVELFDGFKLGIADIGRDTGGVHDKFALVFQKFAGAILARIAICGGRLVIIFFILFSDGFVNGV